MLAKIFGSGNARRGILWTMYDFANSIAVVTFFLYFSQWLVIENGISDFWYNMIFAVSSFLLICSSPVLGLIADKTQRRMPYLIASTILFFVCLIAVSLIALFLPLSTENAFLAAGFYMLGNYFYQLSFSFYNPMLEEVAPPEKRGLVSGLGQSANWLGMILGILVSLPFLGGALYVFGHSGRAQTFLPATLLFLLLVLPTLVFLKDKNPVTVKVKITEEYKNYFTAFFRLMRMPGVGTFLLAFFFFNDAVTTAQNNFPIFMEQVFRVSDKTKSIVLLGILITSALGAFIAGFIADRIGRKKTLLILLGLWALFFPLLGLIKMLSIFFVLAMVMGILYGATWSVTRAVMVDLTPKENLNHAFSYYTLAERFSTFVGPLAWGIVTYWLADKGAVKYQVATISLVVFIIIGFWLVKKIPNGKIKTPSPLT